MLFAFMILIHVLPSLISYCAILYKLMTRVCSFSECESLGLDDFPTAERLHWHGRSPGRPDWSEASRFVAFTLVCFPSRVVICHMLATFFFCVAWHFSWLFDCNLKIVCKWNVPDGFFFSFFNLWQEASRHCPC